LLAYTSRGALVDYYRCGPCGAVWTLPKHDPNGNPEVIGHISRRRDDD